MSCQNFVIVNEDKDLYSYSTGLVLGCEPYEEINVIKLLDRFLSNGFHYIYVKHLSVGRALMEVLLNTLQHYRYSAFLTLDTSVKNVPNIVNIYERDQEMLLALTKEDSYQDIFFLESFYFEFLWIEESRELLGTTWYETFRHKLVEFNLNKAMPVVIFK